MVLPQLPQRLQECLSFLTPLDRVIVTAAWESRNQVASCEFLQILDNELACPVVEHLTTFVQHEVVREAVVFFEREVGGIVRVNFGDGTAEGGPGVGQRGVWSVLSEVNVTCVR